MKRITGTFIDEITWDIPSQNWGKEEWRKEFDTMKDIGIDTVIIIRAGLRDMAVYPSEVLGIKDVPDLALLFLDESERCGMRLFFGSYDTGNLEYRFERWQDCWQINKKLIPEIHKRYGEHPAFSGWYISPETCVATEGSLELYRRHSELMKELTPDKPVLISPYYPAWVYRNDTKEERHKKFVEDWHKIFTNVPSIDICAFQDGSCAFLTKGCTEPTIELEDYIKELHQLCAEVKVTLWNNVETFGRTYPIKFPPIDWRLLKRKMEITDPYVEKQITFEFSHFLSPNSTYLSARTLYRRYCEEIINV